MIAGDLNFPKINWESYRNPESLHQLFLDTFSTYINQPTNIRGFATYC